MQRRPVGLIAFTRTLLLRGGLVLVMPVFFGVDGVWCPWQRRNWLGVVLSVVLLVLMRRRYHYADGGKRGYVTRRRLRSGGMLAGADRREEP